MAVSQGTTFPAALVGSFPQLSKGDSASPFFMMGPGNSPHSLPAAHRFRTRLSR